MRRIRIELKSRRDRVDRDAGILPLDPRDPAVVRAKRVARNGTKDRENL